jgi:hypothetical protein
MPFQKRLARAALKVASLQDPNDGGWGLRASQASSVVNTCEALWVLSASEMYGPEIARGIEYLTKAMPRHCQPRGHNGMGRGQNTRFITFGLLGLAAGRHYWATDTNDTAVWALEWLINNKLEDGWPEVAGVNDASIFQTSAALLAAARLSTVSQLAEGDIQSKISKVAEIAASGLLRHRLSSGAWPRQTFNERMSPAKTSWATIAFTEIGNSDLFESMGWYGSAHDIAARASEVLVSRANHWIGFLELDPDVIGTQWTHLAHPLSLIAITRAYPEPFCVALTAAWRDYEEYWIDSRGDWFERHEGQTIDTIRMTAFCTEVVKAIQHSYGENGERRFSQLLRQSPLSEQSFVIETSPIGVRRIRRENDGHVWPISDLTQKEEALLTALLGNYGEPRWVSMREIALAVGLHESSIGTAVARLRRSLANLTAGDFAEPIPSRRGHGYRLNITRHIKTGE